MCVVPLLLPVFWNKAENINVIFQELWRAILYVLFQSKEGYREELTVFSFPKAEQQGLRFSTFSLYANLA
ncbi:hypothetical protein BTO28_12865 [Domibacillus epiphyticus]|uniref:Uncharacterized protein n=1 Tax=Domibacillus epiphyticus TaxID=1714355 RepID=A0A1V2A5S9_9BACI|nr:hypothetical protein BTO28_12865 [Domibacillus epiphyticus]